MSTTLKLIMIATIVSIVACPIMYFGVGGLQTFGVLVFTATMLATPIARFILKSAG